MIIIYLFAYIRIIEFRLSAALIPAPPCAWHGMKAKKLTKILTPETQLRMIINSKNKMQADSFLTFSPASNQLSTRRVSPV